MTDEAGADANMELRRMELIGIGEIFGHDWQQQEDEQHFALNVTSRQDPGRSVTLRFYVPQSYPQSAQLDCQVYAGVWLPHTWRKRMADAFEQVYETQHGECVIFACASAGQELLEQFVDQTIPTTSMSTSARDAPDDPTTNVRFISCESFTEKKSTFVGHGAVVSTLDEVKQVLDLIRSDRKCSQATHNVYAYRIRCAQDGRLCSDYGDDGESQAGSRLLHLLDVRDSTNVLVVVSRWYGGIHLGADRFRCFHKAAMMVLSQLDTPPTLSAPTQSFDKHFRTK